MPDQLKFYIFKFSKKIVVTVSIPKALANDFKFTKFRELFF